MSPRRKYLTIVLVLLALLAVLLLKPRPDGGAGDAETTQANAAALPRLVDLGATTCVPCRMMAPILDELRTTYAGRFEVQFIDVWQNPAAGEPYRIRVIPTQIFFDARGNELFRHEGFYSREQILGKWQELGFAFTAASPPGEGESK